MSQDSQEPDKQTDVKEDISKKIDEITKDVQELYDFRDLFFENHPIEMADEKNAMVEDKMELVLKKFEGINVEEDVPLALRPQFLYIKGRCYNIISAYEPQAAQCLSKAVKLNPNMVESWNELGECYWKNLNIKEAKATFESALKHERNRVALRCLSIILRQECAKFKPQEVIEAILKSVEYAKEAVALDTKDGLSWTILGNAYLCQFFTIAQDPNVLKSCLSAYKQAWVDPAARGQPDLYYNLGIAVKYEEKYAEALKNFVHACRLDPPWEPSRQELTRLTQYLINTTDLVRTKGKIKIKKLTQMVQNIDKKMLGVYTPGSFHTISKNRDVTLEQVTLASLEDGVNEGKLILGKVIGSIHSENSVPFTFAIVDESLQCMAVTVYNWADGRGAIIGDCVCIPEPNVTHHKNEPEEDKVKYDFKSIRVNNPMLLMLNGKRVGRNQLACTKVTSTYELH